MSDSDKVIVCALTGFLILTAGLAVMTFSPARTCHGECAAVMEAR